MSTIAERKREKVLALNVLCLENRFPHSAHTYFRAGSEGAKRGFGVDGSRSSCAEDL